MVHATCAVYGCLSSSHTNKEMQFHQFPRTEERCKMWINASRREDLVGKSVEELKYTYVCSLHFETNQYGKKHLKKTAVPVLFLPSLTSDRQTQTDVQEIVSQKPSAPMSSSDESMENEEPVLKREGEGSRRATPPRQSRRGRSPERYRVGTSPEPESNMTRCVCAVKTCKNTSYGTKLAFFRFPRDPVRFLNWAEKCKRYDIMNNVGGAYWLCESHFDDSQIIGDKRKTLRKFAVPNLNMVVREDSIKRYNRRLAIVNKRRAVGIDNRKKDKPLESVDDVTDDEPKASTSQQTIIKTERNEQVENLFSINVMQEEKDVESSFETLCDEMLPPDRAKYIKKMASLIAENKNNPDNLRFFLLLYHTHPQIYAALKNELSIPIKAELINHYAPLFTKDRATTNDVLEAKVQCMNEKEKTCSLLIRRVAITPYLYYNKKQDKIRGFHEINEQQSPYVAKYAVIAMVRGIHKDWCLPVDYALLSEKNHSDIGTWFRSILSQLFGLGLDVAVCISNIIPQLYDQISPSKPYMIYGARKIFFMYNPDYLMFQVKRLFMRCQLKFNGLDTDWDHLLKFYVNDCSKTFKLAPDLTDAHIGAGHDKPPPKKVTEQIFSERVAAAVSAYVDFGKIPESARGTVLFISMMAKLVNFFHSNEKSKNKTNKKNNGPENNIVKEVYKIFEGLKVIRRGKTDKNITSQVKLIGKVLITLKCIETMTNDFKGNKCSELPMKMLSMDVLNKLVLNVQKKSKTRRLTSVRLIRAFKKRFSCEIMKWNLRSEKDLPATLVDCFDHEIEEDLPEVSKSDLTSLASLPKKHQFLYVCGLVLKKTYERHKECQAALEYFTFDDCNEEDYGIYLEYREVCSKPLPMIPQDSLVEYLQKVEAEIQKFIRNEVFSNGEAKQIIPRILSKIVTIESTWPCLCFPELYIRELYIRTRLLHLISMNNIEYKRQPLGKLTFRVKYYI